MRKRYWSFIAAVTFLCVCVLSGCAEQNADIPELKASPKSNGGGEFQTYVVRRGEIYGADTIPVTTVPETAELSFTISGVLTDINVNVGDEVKEGQILARLDQSSLEEQIKAQEENIEYMKMSYSYRLQQSSYAIEIAKLRYEEIKDAYAKQEESKKTASKEAADLQGRTLDPTEGEESDIEQEESSDPNDEESSRPNQDESSEPEEEESSKPEKEESSKPEDSSPAPEESSTPGDDHEESSAPEEPEMPQPQISSYDVKAAQLAIEQAQISYKQLQETYQMELAQAETELELTKKQLGNNTIAAPFSGRIVSLNYENGNWVSDYSTVITLANDQSIMLKGKEYSNNVLIRAAKIDVLIGREVYDIEYIPYEQSEYLKLTMLANRINNPGPPPPTRFNFIDEVSLGYGANGLVRVYRSYSEEALILPRELLNQDNEGNYFVYRVEENQRVKVTVVLGIETENAVEIAEGLSEGDIIYAGE